MLTHHVVSPHVAERRIDGLSAARALFANIADATSETAVIAYLNADRRLLGMRHIQGTPTSVTVDPRAVAIDALTFGAREVVMAHNHPSGDAQPSREDLALARRLARALDTLGVSLVDHLVLAGDATTSLRALGYL